MKASVKTEVVYRFDMGVSDWIGHIEKINTYYLKIKNDSCASLGTDGDTYTQLNRWNWKYVEIKKFEWR